MSQPQQMSVDQAIALAAEHHRAGRLQEAATIYRQVLAVAPNHADALHLGGVLACQMGQIDLAIELVQRAIQVNPAAPSFQRNLAQIYLTAGRTDQAIAAARRAVELAPTSAEMHFMLGSYIQNSGAIDSLEAIAAYRRAIELRPDLAEAHFNLGQALQAAGKLDEAEAAYRRAMELKPNMPEPHSGLGQVMLMRGQPDDALAEFDHAIALRPDFAEALSNRAGALRAVGRFENAIADAKRAVELKPKYSHAHAQLAGALRDMGRVDEAINIYRSALKQMLDPRLHFNLGAALLLKGEYREAWPEIEWRVKVREYASALQHFPHPTWNGENLNGRRILLSTEQGFGDMIQFVRYVPMVAQRGGRIVLQCPKPLIRLIGCLPRVEKVISHDEPLPEFDVHCRLPSLPGIFQSTMETIPAKVPYLAADPQLVERWRERLSSERRLKIGLAWSGRAQPNPHRSIRPELLKPLAEIADVCIFSLQKQPSPVELPLVDWMNEMEDFADTASLVANLELVISIDTAVAHLAGAMGKPTWVLLPFVPDWRWMLDRSDSPWYSTMKLFRQKRFGDWSEPIEQVSTALRELAGRHG